MATTFTYKIANMERTLADGVISVLHYTVDAFDGTYCAGAYGSLGLAVANSDEMIAYDDLDEDICLEWLYEGLGEEKMAEIEAALENQLTERKTPSRGAGVPWAS